MQTILTPDNTEVIDADAVAPLPADYELPPLPQQATTQHVPITIHTTLNGRFVVDAYDSWAWADEGLIFATGYWAPDPRLPQDNIQHVDAMIPTSQIIWIECHFEGVPSS